MWAKERSQGGAKGELGGSAQSSVEGRRRWSEAVVGGGKSGRAGQLPPRRCWCRARSHPSRTPRRRTLESSRLPEGTHPAILPARREAKPEHASDPEPDLDSGQERAREGGRLTERVGDELECPAVLLRDLGVEARQVEAVEDVFFIDLGKVLVALGREEPGDPAGSSREEEAEPWVSFATSCDASLAHAAPPPTPFETHEFE